MAMVGDGSKALAALIVRAEELLTRTPPRATYRVQLHPGFTFEDARRIVPYLNELGVSHLYTSPYLKAGRGSTHGYDVVDHGRINPEIGGEAGRDALAATLRAHGMSQILDVVPNHMGIAGNENPWWNDVLENGRSSEFADYFDISWHGSPRPELWERILLPFLGRPYGEALEAGEIRLTFHGGALSVHYADHCFPVEPGTYPLILERGLDDLKNVLPADDPTLSEYLSILTAIGHLPPTSSTAADAVGERRREKEVVKNRLAALAEKAPSIGRSIERIVEWFNGTPGDPRSFDPLDELLSRQVYRLAYWQVATDEINYRRFFDVNGLAALNMERPEVFKAAHALILPMIASGEADGLRIDHPDGLFDPAEYLRRIQEGCLLACARRIVATDPEFQGSTWDEWEGPLRREVSRRTAQTEAGAKSETKTEAESGGGRPLSTIYVAVEKILAAGEEVPEDWPIAGTTGYDFLNVVNGLFVDERGRRPFTQLYRDWIDDATRYRDVVYQKKRLIQNVALASELQMLAGRLDRIAQQNRRSRDFTLNGLRYALREVVACFPVYRSYIVEGRPIRAADRAAVHAAVHAAAVRNPEVSRSLFNFIRDVLLAGAMPDEGARGPIERRRFAGKFQQLTPPVAAKGVEDTAFYNYNRLASLNEVGGDPDRFGLSPETVHRALAERRDRRPTALNPLSTHDSKRSEDARARINVLSEIPSRWADRLARWAQLNEPHRRKIDDLPAPDPNEEYLLYQNLLGAWPLEEAPGPAAWAGFVARMQAFFTKALHEAKVHTSWSTPHADYDSAAAAFVGAILDEAASPEFLADFREFHAAVGHWGILNSLAQTLIRLTAPGVPDTYQGTEAWDFSLVDPDNRRPVDYEARRRMLASLKAAATAAGADRRRLARELIESRTDGRIKLYLVWQALEARRARPELFTHGEYAPLEVHGGRTEHLFGFARRRGEDAAIVAVPRLPATLVPDGESAPLGPRIWGDAAFRLPVGWDLAGRPFRDLLTGRTVAPGADGSIAAAEAFTDFPVVLLTREMV